jgi:hypothetical protein
LDVVLAQPDASAEANILLLSEKKAQFKLVRRVGYTALSLIVLALIYVAWVQGGGSTAPLFIPLPQLMFVMLLGALLLNLTSVLFGVFEVHAASGGETRYLIARHGYSTGLVTAAFAAFFLVIIAALGPVIDTQIDYDNVLALGVRSPGNTVTAPFNVTADYTGSSYLNWVDITSDNNIPFSVFVYQQEDYSSLEDTGAQSSREIVNASYVTHFRLSFVDGTVESDRLSNVSNPIHWERSKTAHPEDDRYMIVLENKELNAASIHYHQDRQLDPAFVGSVYMLLFSLIALNIAAAVYNRVVRQKWRAYGEKNY